MVGVYVSSAWLPVCMSAHMHGFGVHLGVYYQYWGGEKDIVGLGCVCLQKMVGSSVGMDSFLGNS